MPQAVVAGHICLDLMPDLGSRPLDLRPGALRIVGPMTVSTGGAVSNTGIALHRLGVATRLVALVGSDPLGAVLRTALEAESPGLGEGLVVRAGESTSYSVILSSATTDRIVVHFPGANDAFSSDDLAAGQLRGAELLHVGYPPLMRRLCEDDGRELERLLRTARGTGLATSLDMAEPDERVGEIDWRRLLERVLPQVDVFMPSLGELAAMLGRGHVRDGDRPPDETEVRSLAETALGLGAAVAGVKLGRFGLYLRTAPGERIRVMAGRLPGLDAEAWSARELWASIFEVPVRGTTGSGDATIAGFLAALLERRGPVEAADLACATGSLCVEGDDALSGISSRDQAEARVGSGAPRPPLPISASWSATASPGVMAGPRDRLAATAP
ncbi:MAG: carbohydrate kinase family protein [Candidatus Limnocylindrales bacterium]